MLLVIHPTASPELAERAVEFGLVLNPERPRDPFNPREPLHVANLAAFVQRDLANAKLYAVPDADYFILVGGQFVFRVTQFEYTDRDTGDTVRNWDMAFCQSVTDLKWSDGGAAITDLPPGGVVVRSRTLVLKDRTVRQDAKSWLGYLPRIDRALQLRASLARFHEFIRFTNQVELLIRDSEIFQYRVVAHALDSGRDVLTLEETERKRPPIRFARVAGGLCEFLIREIEAHKPEGRLVVLSAVSDDALILPSVPRAHAWTVVHVDADARRVTVQRVSTSGVRSRVPDTGTIRTWGLFGQVALIKRRKSAIDRIAKHAYLLRSLSAPGQVYMDTGHSPLPVPLPVALVDEAKQAAIADVLRVRPIYALQGPPGTGKTTLVAHLLRQIFEDDPVAQVLITAQAHGAVDVLRLKVRHEAFRDVPEDAQPLAVRLGLKAEGAQRTSGSVEEVSLQVLRTAGARLEAQAARTPIQEDWLQSVREMEQALITLDSESTVPDFCEVVKRAASITYCTTSAGDLEALAEATQSFDWAIIEEAGKAHGFDLALPLQTGHRWLLIGDHKQLPPYRFKDYRDGIDGVDDVIEALEALPLRAGFLLDDEWISAWGARSPQERDDFKDYAREWLNTFERVFESCSRATGVFAQTIDESNGSAAGMLSRQHRMHPTIGDLISTAYYQDQLVNRTVTSDGAPLERVRHGLRGVPGLTSEAILWIDLPWAAKDGRSEEVGDAQGRPWASPRAGHDTRTQVR